MKVGILGGTFDPIHCGHTQIASRISEVFGLDRVEFMPARQPPHKGKCRVSHAFHRYAMVVLALLEHPNFYASNLELRRQGASYTIDTLEELAVRHKSCRFCFIAGSDSLQELHLWKDYDKLLLRHCLIFVQRPEARIRFESGTLPRDVKKAIRFVTENKNPDIRSGQSYLIDVDAPPVSSTSIREMISLGREPSPEQLPPLVYQYIKKYRLYEENQENTEEGL